MEQQVHTRLESIYEANHIGEGATRLQELIRLVSSRDDAEDFIEGMDRIVEDGLDGYWTDDGEVYCLEDENCFDSIGSAREYVKEQMNALEWVDVILQSLSEEKKEKDRLIEEEAQYYESVAQRLTQRDVDAMVSLIQESYEEHSHDQDDYNPYFFEKSLLKAAKVELVSLFVSYFSLPRRRDVVAQLINLDWIPEHLLDAFGLLEARDAVRAARLDSSRCEQLQQLLKQLGPISYPNCSDLGHLCNMISSDIPRRRKVIDQLESLINDFS